MTGMERDIGRRRLAERLGAVLQVREPPRRIALALAVGVFIGCTPFLGLQTILAIVLASLFGLSRLATVTGAWLNLPWVAPFVYGAALKLGTLLVPDPDGARWRRLRALLTEPELLAWEDTPGIIRDMSLTLLIGTTLVGAAAALLTYLVALAVISARRSRRSTEPARHTP